jgi:DNA-binding CsgD family transcriptional regulator
MRIDIPRPVALLFSPMLVLVSARLDEWKLIPGDAEVCRQVLEGLDIEEIAALRNTREKTDRQQASTIHRRVHLPGRRAFAAWFIEERL